MIYSLRDRETRYKIKIEIHNFIILVISDSQFEFLVTFFNLPFLLMTLLIPFYRPVDIHFRDFWGKSFAMPGAFTFCVDLSGWYDVIYPSPRLPLGTECLHQDFSQESKGIPAEKTSWLQRLLHCQLLLIHICSKGLNMSLHRTMVFICFVRCA